MGTSWKERTENPTKAELEGLSDFCPQIKDAVLRGPLWPPAWARLLWFSTSPMRAERANIGGWLPQARGLLGKSDEHKSTVAPCHSEKGAQTRRVSITWWPRVTDKERRAWTTADSPHGKGGKSTAPSLEHRGSVLSRADWPWLQSPGLVLSFVPLGHPSLLCCTTAFLWRIDVFSVPNSHLV